MSIENLQQICKTFPGVTEDIKWENHLCLNVGGKMFLVTAPDDVPVSASFKPSVESFDELIEPDGFKPAPHMGQEQMGVRR